MGPTNDPLNFFVLEASECLERLDAVLTGAGPAGPDGAEFVRVARALRGAALMHRQPGIASLAAAVERAGRALRDGAAPWSAPLAAALVAAVDDLKILLHNVRIWGPNEEARAARRLADLERYTPPSPDGRRRGETSASGSAPSGAAYLAHEAADTASALESVVRPGAAVGPALAGALARVRVLRGIAAVHDVPPIPDVLDAVERVARSVETAGDPPTPAQLTLFATAASLLRRAASDLESGGRVPAGSREEQRFAAARDMLAAMAAEANRIVPIAELFYADGAPGVIARAATPPTTPAERFRLEVVSTAEHFRGVVREAQSSVGGRVPDRLAGAIRSDLLAMRSAAEGFDEREVAEILRSFTDEKLVLDLLTLHALDELAACLAAPGSPDDLGLRLTEWTRGRALDAGIAHGLTANLDAQVTDPRGARGVRGATPARATPAPAPVAAPRAPAIEPAAPTPAPVAPPRPTAHPAVAGAAAVAGASRGAGRPSTPRVVGRPRVRTPTGPALQALLAHGIAGITPLADIPLAEHAAEPHATSSSAPAAGTLVPIETLLYRGNSALARARAVRDALRADATPSSEKLAELYDLLDLAASA